MTSRFTIGGSYGMLCAIWGSTWLAIRIGLQGAPAFLAASLRFVVASLTLLALTALFRSRLPKGRIEWSLIAFVGILLFTADYGLIYWGEANGVESGLSAILFATFPFQTALFAHALLREERLSVQKLAGTALGFAGIILIFRGQVEADVGKAFPMVAIVLAATCAAVSSVAVKRWGHDTDPISFNAFAMGTGAIALAAVSLVAGETWFVPSWPEGVGAILYLAFAGSVVTFVAYLWLLKRIEATAMSYIAFVTPIVAVLLGVTIGNEVLDPIAILGAAVTLAGIYLSTSKRAAAWVRGMSETQRAGSLSGSGARIRVRPATREDIPAIVWVSNSSVRGEEDVGFGAPSSESPFADTERLSAAWEDPNRVRGEEVFVAEIDGRVVGCVTVEDRSEALELINIDVPRDLQGRGIGTRIVRFVEERARGEGKRAVTLGTSRNAAGVAWKSLPWWQSRGYRVTGEEENAWTRSIGPGVREIRMRKDLL